LINNVTTIEYYQKRFLKLKMDGEYFESEAKKIVLDIALDTGDFDDPKFNRDKRKNSHYKRIINSLASSAGLMLASLLVSHLTNPQQRWFFLDSGDGKKKVSRDESIWTRECENIMFEKLAKSKLHQTLNNVYHEGSAFGNGVMIKKKHKNGIVYMPLTVGQYYMDQDEFGDINTLARKFAVTAENLVGMFGFENLPERVKLAFKLEGARSKLYTVIHFVEPNLNYLPEWNNPYVKPFISTYYLQCGNKDEKVLEQKGLSEFPYYILRWDRHGTNVYGTGIGRAILGDVRMLQSYERDHAVASKKKVAPPMMGSPAMKTAEKNTGANQFTYTNDTEGFKPLFSINYDVQQATANIQRVEERIRSAYFIDLFFAMMNKDKTMSATEASAVDQEKLVILGAVTDRIRTEFLDKIVEDLFIDLFRQGAFPEPPESMKGKEINIRYQSVLLQSMEMTDLVLLERWLQFTANQAALDPIAALIPDTLEVNEYYATKLGINKKNARSRKEVEDMAAEQAKQQQAVTQEASSKATLNQAKSVEALSNANTTGENALNDLLNG